MPTTTSRQSQTHRSIELTERDLQLLRGLFEMRVMTLAHAAVFYFAGSIEAATKRVQKLKIAGVVAERPRRVYQPSVLFLTKAAFAILEARDILADYPRLGWSMLEKRARVSELTLRHELQVMDVRSAFVKALSNHEKFTLAEFGTWPMLYRFRAAPGVGRRDVIVRPDGFIRIHETLPDGSHAEETFYFELDRSTETQATLTAKAACYGDYYRRGGMAARHGRPRSEYKLFPFRVLIVCRNTERRNNAAARMLHSTPPILRQVWLTTFDEVLADPLGPIWMQPIDYRDAVAGTAFDVRESQNHQLYIRQTARETLVDESLRKLHLFQHSDSDLRTLI